MKQSKNDGNALLTVKEAAAYLRVSDATVRRQIKSQAIPGIKVGRDFRIPVSQLAKTLYFPNQPQPRNKAA